MTGRVISNGSERGFKAQGNILFIITVSGGTVNLSVGWEPFSDTSPGSMLGLLVAEM